MTSVDMCLLTKRNLADSRVFFIFILIFSGASFGFFCLPSCPGSPVNQQWLLWLHQAHLSMECGALTLLQWPVGTRHTLHLTIWSVTFLPKVTTLACVELKVCIAAFIWSYRSTVVCLSGSFIVEPHNDWSSITWGDSVTVCSVGRSPGLAVRGLGFTYSAVTLGHISLNLPIPVSFWIMGTGVVKSTRWISRWI